MSAAELQAVDVFRLAEALTFRALVAVGLPEDRPDLAPVLSAYASQIAERVRSASGAPAWAVAVCDAAVDVRDFSAVREGESRPERDARWLAGAPALIERMCAAYAGPDTAETRAVIDTLRSARLVARRPGGAR